MRGSLPADPRWVDHAKLGPVDLVAPPGSQKEQTWLQLLWNTSVTRLLLVGSPPIDQFPAEQVRVSHDGRLLVDGKASRPMLAQTYGSTVQMTGVKLVRHEPIFDLYRPVGTPRMQMIAAGRFLDGWLAPRGVFTV